MVWGSGFRVRGSGCEIEGLWFGVQGSGCRVQGSWFRVQGLGLNLPTRVRAGVLDFDRSINSSIEKVHFHRVVPVVTFCFSVLIYET